MTAEFTGATFGQYEIQDQLEGGGIIHTYRALQKSLQRPVALHVVSPRYRTEDHWKQAFITGATIAANLEHPNILPVIDYGLHDDLDYVVVRLVEGGSLRTRLESGPLQPQEASTIVHQIASALDYVHSQDSCHGDPATVNIIFDKSGSAFIADFYLLGFLKVTQAETPAGVTAFMAPERFVGSPPSPLTDQYALAGVAYTMLAGKTPREAANKTSLMGPIELPKIDRPEIPPAVIDVLYRALDTDPGGRYATIMDFARQFEQALKSTPPHIFISYSRRDGDYVQVLRNYLRQNGMTVWVDDQIEHGDQWFNDINDAIKTCAAFLVIMSPDAENSEWVQKEILLAKRYQKPIFPLLLRGQEFPILIDLQFADVRGEQLPQADFHRRISRALYGE